MLQMHTANHLKNGEHFDPFCIYKSKAIDFNSGSSLRNLHKQAYLPILLADP